VLAAQLLGNLAVAVVVVVLFLVVARLRYQVLLPRQSAGWVIALLLAVAALMSIGLPIAAVAPSAKAAQMIGMLFSCRTGSPDHTAGSDGRRPGADLVHLGAGRQRASTCTAEPSQPGKRPSSV
jgi:hypothetical protein